MQLEKSALIYIPSAKELLINQICKNLKNKKYE